MSSRKRGGKTNKQPADEPQQEAEAETLVNTNAEARKLRKLRKKGLLDQPVNEEPVQPDQEAVASQINQEKMASAVSGIDQKAIAAADTNSKDVQVLGFDMKYKDQNLLEGADLKILHGRRYGIIGPNGAGKSTLLRHIAHRMIPIPKHIQVLYVEQEIDGSDTIALDAVVAADTERIALLAEQEQLKEKLENLTEDDENGIQMADRLAEVEDRLIEIRAATAVERAGAILSGLQFTPKMKGMATKDFSGGWRMRIALARALFVTPDLLMLDEPTNHLDLEASIWLEHYLSHFKKTLLLVSHDRDFLNDVINFRERKLEYYKGNFDEYENLLKAKLAEQRKLWEKEQKMLKELQKKQTPDALNKLEAMKKAGLMAEPKNWYEVRFKFEDVGYLEFPVIQMDKVSFGYEADKQLFNKQSAYLDCASRIAIVGPNGSGDLTPSFGEVRLNRHLRIAKFSQHFMDQLTMEETPLSFITKKIKEQKEKVSFEKANEEEREKPPEDRAKTMLCKFNLKHELFNKPIALLSGGQKCRVALCDVAVQRPHIFFLDEPTNHLDMKSVDALLNGLKSFPGGIVIITHDQRMVTSIAKELWICRGDQKVEKWHLDGVEHSFDDYRQEIFDSVPDDLFEDDDDDGEAERERKMKYKKDRHAQQGRGGRAAGQKGGRGGKGGDKGGAAPTKGGKQSQQQKGGAPARGGKAARGKK